MFNVFLSGNLSDILFGILYGMLNRVLSGAFTGFIRAFTLAIFGNIWHFNFPAFNLALFDIFSGILSDILPGNQFDNLLASHVVFFLGQCSGPANPRALASSPAINLHRY